jgi:hypothetical protein
VKIVLTGELQPQQMLLAETNSRAADGFLPTCKASLPEDF